MNEHITIRDPITLAEYAQIPELAHAVQELRSEAATLVAPLRDRRIWMVNSTAMGGGVAEMLPKLISIMRELGVDARWLVMGSDQAHFFEVTKQIHNLIHGEGDPAIDDADRSLYERVNRENAAAFQPELSTDDILVIHDPQPLAAGAYLKKAVNLRTIWRCHIGLDVQTPETEAAWKFLRPHALDYDFAVFTAPEYIPDYLAGRCAIITPALDPLSHKNRPLSIHKIAGILCNAGLEREHSPVVTPPFPKGARRLQPNGEFASGLMPDDLGLIYRPIVTEVSRWDRLKGFQPLLEGFVRLKKGLKQKNPASSDRHRKRLEIARLVLAGPDPESVADDPEGREVLAELCAFYRGLDAEYQKDVALIALPMDSRKFNALIVNAIQRCSTIIAQNSIREGFGLTATEAMWKGIPVMGTSAVGLRHQIRDGIDGRLVQNPEDPEEVANVLNQALENQVARDSWARSAQRRVHREFLIFTQVVRWLRLLNKCALRPPRPASKPAGD